MTPSDEQRIVDALEKIRDHLESINDVALDRIAEALEEMNNRFEELTAEDTNGNSFLRIADITRD